MLADDIQGSIFKFAQRWLFIVIRYPSLSSKYVAEFNEGYQKCPMRPEDMKSIDSHSSTASKWPTLLIIAIYFIYIIRNTLFVILSYSTYDHRDLESNLITRTMKQHENETLILFSFACLDTNCSQLSAGTTAGPAGLAEDFSLLPISMLCNPSLDGYLSPVARLESFGLMVLMTMGFYVFFLGAWIPMRQFWRPASDETFMFISAPSAAIQLMRCRCERLLFDMHVSYGNFCARRGLESSGRKPDGPHLINNCMPLVRSNWWHTRLLAMYCVLLAGVVVVIGATVVLILLYLSLRMARKSTQLSELQLQTSKSNCALWKSTNPNDIVDLSQIRLHWKPLELLEVFLYSLFPGLGGSVLAILYYTITFELLCWLAELRSSLLSCLVCCKFTRSARQIPRMTELRRQFSSQIGFKGAVVLVKRIEGRTFTVNSESGEALMARQVANKLVKTSLIRRRVLDGEQNDTIDEDEANLETLESIYVQFRLFMEHIRALSPGCTLFTTIVYVLNYGLVFIGVFVSSHERNLTTEPMMLVVTGWLLSNVFILLAANFHANVSRFHGQIQTKHTTLTNNSPPIRPRNSRHSCGR